MKALESLKNIGNLTVQDALQIAKNYLRNFALSPNFKTQMQIALGNLKDWATTDLTNFPKIEVRPGAEINQAKGAFAAATNTIYLSQELVDQNRGNVDDIASVLLEEYGHYLDSQVNPIDSPGDEGAIFADLVQGKALSQGELAALKAEDDSAIVILDGKEVRIEQAETTSKKDTLDFFAGEIKDWGGGSVSNRFEKELYKKNIPDSGKEIGGKVDNLFIKYDWDLKSEIKASVFATPGNYGEAKFSYPVDIAIQTPKNVELGETFSVIPGVGIKSASATFDSNTRGFELPNAGFKLDLNLIKAQLKGVAIKAPWRTYELPISVDSSIGQAELSFDVIKYPQGSIDLPGGTGKISVSTPKIKDGISPKTARDLSDPVLPDIAASGKSSNIIDLEADFDKLLAISFPPLAVLGNEVEASSPDGRVKAKLSYDLLDIKGNVGFGLQQDFTFDPDRVDVTFLLDGQPEKKGILGNPNNKFEFKAPSQGSGLLKVKAKYELFGKVKNNIGAIIQGGISATALQAGTEFQIGNWNGKSQLGPLLSVKFPEGGAATDPFPLIGSPQSKPTDPKPQFPILKTIEISGMTGGGIEKEDKNPQDNATKNLIIEKEYEIPYNLPYSISDARADEGKNLVFTVSRREASNEPITLVVEYENQTASSGDYSAGQTTVTIPAGQVSADVTVATTQDNEVEGTETFKVKLKKPDGSSFATNDPVTTIDATGIIIDDDEKPKPPQPEQDGRTYNDPRIVTIDSQYHDFQAAGEFTLIESTTGDLKIQVRQQPVGNNPRSNVSDNTAVATVLGGKRIGIYKDQGLLIDGQPIQIANNNSLVVGDGRIYREGNIYTVVYPNGEQLVAKVVGTTRVNVNVYLTEERQGKVKGLLGNFNNNPKDDLAKHDGTVIPEPVSQQQLYGEYADSWRVNQAESLFDYKPGENTNTFTLQNYPRKKVKISDLNPTDVAKAQQLIGDRVKNPTTREAAIIDLVLTNFDPDILQEALNAPDPESVVAIASPFTANSDFYSTPVNTPVKINVLANDTTTKDPLSIKEFNAKSVAGGTITLDNNNTPDNQSDDQLFYTPPPNFTGNDTFNYVLTDGKQIQVATVTVNTNSLKLSNLSGNNGFVVNGTEPGNFSGVAVSKTGDINGDKIDDIAIGSFAADPNGVNAAGKSQVVFGGKNFPASVNLSELNGQNGFTLNGTDAEGFSGGSLSNIGDINGDGLSDFVIGAFGAPVNGQNNRLLAKFIQTLILLHGIMSVSASFARGLMPEKLMLCLVIIKDFRLTSTCQP